MLDLIEKPSARGARLAEERYGANNLFLLEGRFHLTTAFITFAHNHAGWPDEPKLSLTLRDFARRHPVRIVVIDSTVTDLGAPQSPDPPLRMRNR